MIVYTARWVAQHGGHGDRLLASVHDWRLPWYMNYHTPRRAYFNASFRAPRPQLEVPLVLQRWAAGLVTPDMVMLEPHVKRHFSADNKDWGWARWEELVKGLLARRVPLVQCAPLGKEFLTGVKKIRTPTFLHACAVLQRVRGIVTTSGGLHIAAAALRKPAVVIWGSFSDPAVLGYEDQVNLYRPDPDGLGQRQNHPACRRAMERISVRDVMVAMQAAFPDVVA